MWSVRDNDHITKIMKRTNTFYEIDVLERIRQRLSRRGVVTTCVDIGAFIGTHSIYFSKYCGFKRVLAFEPNEHSFPVVQKNILENNLQDSIVLVKKALGAKLGCAIVLRGKDKNEGTSTVVYDTNDGDDPVEVSTLDHEVTTEQYPLGISLIKIDVEGAELEVIQGARDTIKNYKPLLCVEIHKTKNLRKLLWYLRNGRYWIIDCLGMSPTYILEPAGGLPFRRLLVNFLWLTRSALPQRHSNTRWYLARFARAVVGDN